MTDFTPHTAPAKEIHQLPVMATTRPVGRDALLKEIYEHLRNGGAVLLHGAGGMGKTTLAAALATAYTQQSGGVLWLDGHLGDFTSLLAQIGRAYALEEVTTSDNPQAHVGIVSATLMQNKPFIIVDNVTNVGTIAPFVDKVSGKLPTLLLAEEVFEGNWTPIEVDKLEDIDALTLFKQKAGINDNAQDIAIYGITKQLQYHAMPLAIAARGMVAAKQDADTYAHSISEVTRTIGGDSALATIATSYRALNNALQGLLLMLGASPTGAASAELLTQVSGVPTPNIDQAVTILTQLFLAEKITRYGAPFYRLHPLVHRFALASLKGSNRLESLQDKFQDALIAYAKKYGTTTPNHAMLANEMENFIAIARHAANQGNRDIANQFLVTLTQADDFVTDAGYVYELLVLRALGSGSTAAFPAYGLDTRPAYDEDYDEDFDEDFDDDFDDDNFEDVEDGFPDEGDFGDDEDFDDDDFAEDDFDDDDFDDDDDFERPQSLNVARSASSMGLPPTSPATLEGATHEELRIFLQQAKEHRDTKRILEILGIIGKMQISEKRNQEAIATYNEILQIQDKLNGEGEVLPTLDMLTSLLNKTGNTQAAIMHATRGVQLARQANDEEALMQLLMQLGDARQELGESTTAVSIYSEALSIARQRDDSQHEAIILYKLGYAYLDEGEPDTAIHSWTQARDLFKGQGKRDYEGRVMGALGTAHADMGNWNDAIRYYKTALHVAREVGDREEEALQLGNLGQSQQEANLLPDALISYRQALHLAYQSDQKDNIVSAVMDLVALMLKSNRLLDICNLLLDSAIELDSNDRDLMELKEAVMAQRAVAVANGARLAPVNGTARDYAALAYELLEG